MKKITVSILTTLLMLSMVFSSSVFAANEKVSAWDSFLGLFGVKATETSDVGVEYRGHVENKGDFPVDGTWIQGPDRLGTVGEGLRLEAFWIKLADDAPEGLHIEYQVHVQNKGWMGFVNDGARAGTAGEGLRIEAIEIALVDDEGEVAQGYSVEYRGHVQNIGDTEWYADGDQLGTTGSGLRLEALEIKIVQTKADMTAYEAALAAVEEADYTKASWAAYQAVVDANVVTEDNSQAEVDAATEAIVDAQEDLVEVPVITGMTATGQKAITVTGTELSKLAPSMFTVAGNTVTSIVANADGTNAVIALTTNLAPETNVKVTATIDGTAKEYTVKYSIAATTVVIEDQTFDMNQTGQKVALLVNGVATTPDYLVDQGYAVSFVTWNSNGNVVTSLLNAGTGAITVPQATEADYTAQVTISKGATIVTSSKASIKIKNLNNNISDITSVTLKNYDGAADTYAIASNSLVVNQNARISKVVVGYGTAASELINQVGYTVSSDNTAVATVNSSGVITATGLGSANLKITAGKATYTLPITVNGTARKAVTVALADNASSFTALFGNTITSTNMTVVVKDQYGDPFAGASAVTFTTPGSITALTLTSTATAGTTSALGTVTDNEGKVVITAALGGTAVNGQTGVAVFRDSDNNVIGSASIVTSNNNVATTKKLVVSAGPTDNTIDTELASKAAITFQVGEFNSAGVQTGTVANLGGYTITCDNSIISVTGATKTATGYTIAGTPNNFVVTGLKAGTTTMLVKDPNNVIETRTITVAKGEVKITGVSFLTPSTITNVGTVNYTNVLAYTEVAAGRDPALTGITTTPTSVHSIRLDVNNGATLGQIYLDKDASYTFTAGDVKIGQLSFTKAIATGSTGWAAATDAITQGTTLGNKGTITFNVVDSISTGTPTVASKGVTVDVPTTAGTSALTALAVTGGTLTPGFGAAVTSYTVPDVTYATGSITVTPTQAAAGATITVNGTAVASGTASGAIALDAGVPKTINVVVTEVGKTPLTYTIVATRAVDAAPSSSFTFNTGVLTSVVGSQYSLDGGTTYSAALTAADPVLSVTELNSITATNGIKVRTAAIGAGQPGAVQTIAITTAVTPSGLTPTTDGSFTVTAASNSTEYQYSTNGTTWTNVTSSAGGVITLPAAGTYQIRLAPVGTVQFGAAQTGITVS